MDKRLQIVDRSIVRIGHFGRYNQPYGLECHFIGACSFDHMAKGVLSPIMLDS